MYYLKSYYINRYITIISRIFIIPIIEFCSGGRHFFWKFDSVVSLRVYCPALQLRQEHFRSWMSMSYNPCRNYQGYHLYPRPQFPSEVKEITDKFQLFFLLRFSRPTTWPAQRWIFYYEVGICISKREQVLKQRFSRTRAEQYNNDNDISCTRARKLPNRRKVQSLNGRE